MFYISRQSDNQTVKYLRAACFKSCKDQTNFPRLKKEEEDCNKPTAFHNSAFPVSGQFIERLLTDCRKNKAKPSPMLEQQP